MTEHEWLTSADPQAMLKHLQTGLLKTHERPGGVRVTTYHAPLPIATDRKLRLFACACRRRVPNLEWRGQSQGWADMEQYPERKILANGIGPHAIPAIEHARLFSKRQANPSQSEMAHLLRDIFGNPWRPITIQPHWLTSDVKALAQAAYEERQNPACYHCRGAGRVAPAQTEGIAITVQSTPCQTCHGTGRIETGHLDPDRLLILADALEEAGCDNEEMLRHLRGICRRCRGKRVINRRVSDPYDGVGRATVQLSCPDCVCSTCDGNGFYFDDSGGNIGIRKHCSACGSSGHLPTPGHVRGCWVVDLLLGKE